jgi:hypothetical protein
MSDYYAQRRAASRAMYPRTDAARRRFEFVGEYTVREREDGTVEVTREIGGDDVFIVSGLTWAASVRLAKGAGA